MCIKVNILLKVKARSLQMKDFTKLIEDEFRVLLLGLEMQEKGQGLPWPEISIEDERN